MRRAACGRRLALQRLQRRRWSEEFRSILEEPEINCRLGNVPYYEGHPLVALLFGWPGATEEGMRQYSAIYDRMGVPSVLVLPSWREAHVDDAADMKVQRLFAELQVELCNLRTDLVLHYFSASFLQFLGPMVYLGRRVTKGIIFDSCPTQRHDFLPWYNANRVSRAAELLEEGGLIPGVGPIARKVATMRSFWREYRDAYRTRAREMSALEMMFAPQLYLHCKDDPLIQKKSFAELIEYQRERKNMKVWEVAWPGDRHMGHLQAHSEEYEMVVRDFVQGIQSVPIEQLEVGRNAGAEWPPAVPTDEEMLAAAKWTRAYLSPYHEQEIALEAQLRKKRERLVGEQRAISDGQPFFRYPDGSIKAEPTSLEETEKYIAENTPEFPVGVQDLRNRSHIQRTPTHLESNTFEVQPPRHQTIYVDQSKP
ncbi:hypothetical protein DIPPA_07964 [Diplonema papillatum]|nr:hypothetical protein DIPPA_07964 [Diplonema papillatum]|eukprot:gene2954-4645_t